MDGQRYLDIKGASAYCRLSVSHLQKLCCRRKIPFIKMGRRCIFDARLLDRWLSRRAVLPRDWHSEAEGRP